MHRLAFAVGRKGLWHSLDAAVRDTVWNNWAEDDNVLRGIYRLADVGEVAAGEAGFRWTRPKIKDHNVSRLAPGHTAYVSKAKLQAVRDR